MIVMSLLNVLESVKFVLVQLIRYFIVLFKITQLNFKCRCDEENGFHEEDLGEYITTCVKNVTDANGSTVIHKVGLVLITFILV